MRRVANAGVRWDPSRVMLETSELLTLVVARIVSVTGRGKLLKQLLVNRSRIRGYVGLVKRIAPQTYEDLDKLSL